MTRLLAFVMLFALGGCTNVPQAGTYHGPDAALGRPVLRVHRDGAVEEKHGPLVGRGTWTPLSDFEIKAEVQALTKHPGVRYYRLERLDRSYRVAFSLEELRTLVQPDGAANGSQPIRSGTNRTSSAAGSRR